MTRCQRRRRSSTASPSPASASVCSPRVRLSWSTTKTPLSPSVVFAFVGPRPVVRASALTTVVEILAASSPSCHWRSLLIAALRTLVLPSSRSRGLDGRCDARTACAGDCRRAERPDAVARCADEARSVMATVTLASRRVADIGGNYCPATRSRSGRGAIAAARSTPRPLHHRGDRGKPLGAVPDRQ